MGLAYILEGLLSEEYLRLKFGGLIFGRAYFFVGGGGGGLISEFTVLKYLRAVSYFVCGQCLFIIFIIDVSFCRK